jgi:hypothetical protein
MNHHEAGQADDAHQVVGPGIRGRDARCVRACIISAPKPTGITGEVFVIGPTGSVDPARSGRPGTQG